MPDSRKCHCLPASLRMSGKILSLMGLCVLCSWFHVKIAFVSGAGFFTDA